VKREKGIVVCLVVHHRDTEPQRRNENVNMNMNMYMNVNVKQTPIHQAAGNERC
jgi:hypothetical protein